MDSPVPPAQFAMQMLRFPLRQVFGDTSRRARTPTRSSRP